jgi:hypothetical protein
LRKNDGRTRNNANTHPENNRPVNQPGQPEIDRMYQIACSLPALRRKGVEQGDIPGIQPDGFHDGQLHDFLYQGSGGAWRSGEVLILQFLLDLYDPYEYKAFNFGRALFVLDQRNMAACINAARRYYNRQ